VPDNNLKHEMQTGERRKASATAEFAIPSTIGCEPSCAPGRDETSIDEAGGSGTGIGILKRAPRMRSSGDATGAVTTEWMLAAIAFNLTRMARSIP